MKNILEIIKQVETLEDALTILKDKDIKIVEHCQIKLNNGEDSLIYLFQKDRNEVATYWQMEKRLWWYKAIPCLYEERLEDGYNFTKVI